MSLHHVESRQRRKAENDRKDLELLITLEGAQENLVNVVKNLKLNSNVHDIVVLSEKQREDQGK